MRRKLLKLIKIVAFLLLAVCMVTGIFKVLWQRDDTYSSQGFQEFYDLPKDTVDVMIYGSSGMKEFFNPTQAYHDFGVTVGNLTTSNQPMAATKYLIEEAQKNQHPKLYIMDTRQLQYADTWIEDGAVRRVTDSMNISRNWYNAVTGLYDLMTRANPDQTYNLRDYFFSFGLYHSRWKEVADVDFTGYPDLWEGFLINVATEPYDNLPGSTEGWEGMELEPLQQESLTDLLEYCKTQDAEFLFINPPYYMEENHLMRSVTVGEQIRAAGFEYIDFNNVVGDMYLNPQIDFRDWAHVNAYGSIKYTDYVTNFIQQKYGLEDHRNQDGYSIYEEKYQGYAKRLLNLTPYFDQYLNVLPRYSNTDITISYSDDVWNTILSEELKTQLQALMEAGILTRVDDASGGLSHYKNNAICIEVKNKETGETWDTAQYLYSSELGQNTLMHNGEIVIVSKDGF